MAQDYHHGVRVQEINEGTHTIIIARAFSTRTSILLNPANHQP